MKKILILANNDVGLYNFRKELIERLLTDGFQVFIALPYGERVEYFNKLGCIFFNTPISRRGKNIISDIKLLLTYLKIVEDVNPDLILTYTVKPNIYGGIIASIKKIPFITNITGLGSSIESGKFIRYLTLILYKLALRKASCVFFQNSENENFMKQNNVVKGRYRLVPGSGVNTAIFQYLPYPQDEVVTFAFISRIMREKGIDEYIEAARIVKSKHKNVEFLVIGPIEENYEVILAKNHESKIINYVGNVDDVRKYLKIINCIIHPTYYPEGMSNVLLESAACGRPAITTNRSGCREIVEDGVTGFLVEPKNVTQLVSKIEQFLKMSIEQQREMGRKARNKVEKEFNREFVVNAYMEEIALSLKLKK